MVAMQVPLHSLQVTCLANTSDTRINYLKSVDITNGQGPPRRVAQS